MAIGADFAVAVNGSITHTSGTTTYTVLELHRWLQDLADDAQASGDDNVDIVTSNPSERSTDNIITLLDYSATSGPTFNIDDDAAEYFYNGSVTQRGGNEVYSGLEILGAASDSATQLMVIQDNGLYQFTPTPATPFWGTVADAFNVNGDSGILARFLVKSRVNGADIDEKKIRVQARHMDAAGGDTFDFFGATLGIGISVAAISTTPDVQNDSDVADLNTYTHVTNSGGTANAPTGGFQSIDLNNGNGAFDYYSQWTFGADTNGDQLKSIWEYTKQLTYQASTKTVDSLTGYLFLGITHDIAYDTEAAGPFTERETVVWGSTVVYNTLAGGTFAAGNYIVFDDGADITGAGRVMYDDGAANCIIAVESVSNTIATTDVMTEYEGPDGVAGATGVTAVVNGAPGNITQLGGSGLLLALDDNGADGNLYVQLLTGNAPAFATIGMRGITSSTTAQMVTTTAKTVSKQFTGSYTGSYIGAYGIGFLAGNLTASELVTPLVGANQTPPNNVVFTVSGLVSGEDRVLVAPRTGTAILESQFATTATYSGATTSIAVTPAIPSDTPTAGVSDSPWIRVKTDLDRWFICDVTSWTGSTFTITSKDFSGDTATSGNDAFIGYIDLLAGAASEAFTAVFNTTRDLFVRVRDGGGTPTKQFESTAAQLTATGGTVAINRVSDL